jgi:ribosomal protein L16 Arg81 hydroxylase
LDVGVILKHFGAPDEVREMTLGRFETVHSIELRPGDVFYIPPEAHDSWVVGE